MPVRLLDFTIQLRSTAFDVGVADAQILNVPVEFAGNSCPLSIALHSHMQACAAGQCPERGAYFLDAERELFNDVVDEVDCICLSMFFINFKGADSPSVRWLAGHYMLEKRRWLCIGIA